MRWHTIRNVDSALLQFNIRRVGCGPWHVSWICVAGRILPRRDIIEALNSAMSRELGRQKGFIMNAASNVLRSFIKPQLLVTVGITMVPATKKPFVASDCFVRSKGNSGVRFMYLSDEFRRCFLGKEERSFIGSMLRYDRIIHPSLDDRIIAELGGKKRSETTLFELYALLQRQPTGVERGPLLRDGHANIFYIPDLYFVLRAVNARLTGDGWDMFVRPFAGPEKWLVGCRIFSRDHR